MESLFPTVSPASRRLRALFEKPLLWKVALKALRQKASRKQQE